MKRTRPHDSLMRAVCDYLELGGVPYFRVNQRPIQRKDGTWRNSGATVGAPDIVAIVAGRMVWIEVKTGKARMRPAQMELAHRFENRGAVVWVVRDVADLPGLVAGVPLG